MRISPGRIVRSSSPRNGGEREFDASREGPSLFLRGGCDRRGGGDAQQTGC